MFAYLRHLRRKLIQSNSFLKYFLYGLGELLLIVLGILLALYVDNWNDHRLEKKRERFYLTELRAEFEASRVKLENLIEANRQTYRKASEIANVMARGGKGLGELEFSGLLFHSFSDEMTYNPNNSVLQELLNSGRLEYLSDPSLRGHLTTWSSRLDQIRQQEQNLRDQRGQVMELTLQEGGSIRGILENTGILTGEMELQASETTASNLDLLQSQNLENHLLIFILTARLTEQNHYLPLHTEIVTILELIDSSLGK
jgi:hypothetical protein